MPWTIWPALVVLWGVCWMFYPGQSVENSRGWPLRYSFEEDPVSLVGRDLLPDNDWLTENDCKEIQTAALRFTDFDLYRTGYCGEEDSLNVDFFGIIDDSSEDLMETMSVSTASHKSQLATVFPTVRRPASTRSMPPAPSANQQGYNAATSQDSECTDNDEGKQRHIPATRFSAGQGQVYEPCSISSEDDLQTTALSGVEATQDGRHVCPICPKSVSRKEDLDRHKLTHSEARHFCTYPVCTRIGGFNRKDNRDQHIRKIHQADPKQYSETRATLPNPGDSSGNVPSAPAGQQSRKRRRVDSSADGESDVENVYEKIRRLENELAQSKRKADQFEREMARLQATNEALVNLVQTLVKQGK